MVAGSLCRPAAGSRYELTHEVDVGRAPTHQFRDRQLRQRGRDHVGSSASVLAFHVGTIQQPFAFIGRQTFSLIDGDTAAARPAFGRFARWPLASNAWAIAGPRFSTSRSACAAARFALSAPDGAVRQTIQLYRARGQRYPALRSRSQQRIQPGCAVFWWQLFSADFHQESFLRHGRLLFILVAHREAQGFTEA